MKCDEKNSDYNTFMTIPVDIYVNGKKWKTVDCPAISVYRGLVYIETNKIGEKELIEIPCNIYHSRDVNYKVSGGYVGTINGSFYIQNNELFEGNMKKKPLNRVNLLDLEE
jgi:hypothetical protein